MSYNGPVLALNLVGGCIASMAVIPLRDVASLVRSPGLRRAWTALACIPLCCIGLLLTSSAMSFHRVLDVADLAAGGIHVLGPCFVLCVAWLSRGTALHMLRIDALEEAAYVDPLTGLANRRRFEERLAEEVRDANALGRPLSLLALDIDHFKRINDTYGHGIGDLVLQQIATLIAVGCRHLDTACRVGGEEFVVIAPGLEGAFAAAFAEELRHVVAETRLRLDDGSDLRATISLGLATLRSGETADMLSRRADAALYVAKRSGRDRVSLTA